MIERLFVNQNALKAKRGVYGRAFLDPSKTTYTLDEERKFIVSLKPSVQHFLNQLYSKTNNSQINGMNSDFIRNGFNLKKNTSKEMLKNLERVNELCVNLMKGSSTKKYYENTTIEVYANAYKALTNPKIISFFNNIYKKFRSKFKEKSNVLSTLNPHMQFFYLGSLSLLNMYLSLNQYVMYTALLILTELDLGNYNDAKGFNAVRFDQANSAYTRKATYNVCILADYCLVSKLDNVTSLLNKSLNKGLSMEDLQFEKIKSQESAALGLAVVIGMALGLISFMPALRQFLYFIESLKVDLSNLFLDHSEMMAVNVKILEEKLAQTKDPREADKLKKIISKSKDWVERLKNWSEFWYPECERSEDTAENMETVEDNSYRDEDYEDTDDYNEDNKQSSPRPNDEPDIFL